jgi:YVTN family beta-propeller protein
VRTLAFIAAVAAGACATARPAEDLLLVANKEDATLSIVQVASRRTLAVVPTGAGPHEVSTSPDGRWAVVSNYGIKGQPGNSLTVVDLAARSVARTIDLGEYHRPHGSAFLPDGRLVVTSETSEALVVVDVARGAVERAIATGQKVSHMVALGPGGARAYTANIMSGTVTALDVRAGQALASAPAGTQCEGIAASPDGAEVWAGSNQDNVIHVLDGATLAAKATIPAAGMPIRLRFTPDGARVLVSNAAGSKLQVLTAATREVVRTLDFAPPEGQDTAAPVGIVIDPEGRLAYVSLVARDEVAIVDLGSLAIVGKIPAGKGPDGIAYARRR